jgi:nucleoside-diphosphate-sugar epimerase
MTKMQIFLTGATGYVGSSVLTSLLAAGHDVTALVRSDEKAAQVTAAGATPLIGDITDTGLLASAAGKAEAVIHVASPGDATSAEVDAAVVDAFLGALRGTGKTYIHTSGVWIHGSGGDIQESTPFDPPAVTAWRLPLDARVLAAAVEGVRSIVIAPGIVYGHGGGLPNLILHAPRNDSGELLFPGSGEQHWASVHVDDLGPFYLAALEKAPAGSYFLAVSGDNPTVRELALAVSDKVAPEPVEQTQSRIGALLGALALDQQASGRKARAELGWVPVGPSLLSELASGSYAR